MKWINNRDEILRWIGSIGIFYIIVPIAWLLTGRFYKNFITIDIISKLGQAQYPLGILLCLFGVFLIYSSFRDQLRLGKGHPFDIIRGLSRPTKILLTNGVYYWSRNPMNLGDMFLFGGLSIIVNCNGGLIINLPLYYLIVWINSNYLERPILIGRFGDEYIEYEKNTSTIIPGLRTLRKLPFKIGSV